MSFAAKWNKVLEAEAKSTVKPKKLIQKNSNGWCSIIAYSKVLGKDIQLTWQDNNAAVVYVDQTPYSLDEIAEMKTFSKDAVIACHNIKNTFDGKIGS